MNRSQTCHDALEQSDDAKQDSVRIVCRRVVRERPAIAKAETQPLHQQADDLLERLAIVKRDTDPHLTPEAAYGMAVEEHPLLYEAIVASDRDVLHEGSEGAWAEIEKRAEQIQTTQQVTSAEAVSRVLEQFPHLYEQYVAG